MRFRKYLSILACIYPHSTHAVAIPSSNIDAVSSVNISNPWLRSSLPCQVASSLDERNGQITNLTISTDITDPSFQINVARGIEEVKQHFPLAPKLYLIKARPITPVLDITSYDITMHFISITWGHLSMKSAEEWGTWNTPEVYGSRESPPRELEAFDWEDMQLDMRNAIRLVENAGFDYWYQVRVTKPHHSLGQRAMQRFYDFSLEEWRGGQPKIVAVGDRDRLVFVLEKVGAEDGDRNCSKLL